MVEEESGKENKSIKLPIKFVQKGWGYERWIVNCEEYCGKLLFFEKDKKCSWHYHVLKDEVFYLQSGLDWRDVTEKQFSKWGVKYHELKFGKPNYDLFIDDKNIGSERFFSENHNVR